jgi:hypothetical protein
MERPAHGEVGIGPEAGDGQHAQGEEHVQIFGDSTMIVVSVVIVYVGVVHEEVSGQASAVFQRRTSLVRGKS